MPTRYATFDEYLGPNVAIEQVVERVCGLPFDGSDHSRWLPLFSSVRRLSFAKRRERRSASQVRQDGLVTELVAKGKAGDGDAMELLIKWYQLRVAGFVLALVNDGEAVEDICQTIFLKAIGRLYRLRENERFEAWLFRIARNTCFDHLRRRRLRGIFLPWKDADDRFASTLDLMPDSAGDRRIDLFRRALLKLPKKQRELIALLQDDRLSYERLAEITNSSVSSVKSRLFRARRQLRKFMHDER